MFKKITQWFVTITDQNHFLLPRKPLISSPKIKTEKEWKAYLENIEKDDDIPFSTLIWYLSLAIDLVDIRK